jgi:DegV family protein with EDD domain
MNRVAIITDTTACIPHDLVKKYAIELVPVSIIIENRVYRDCIDISPTEFYSLVKQVKNIPTTSHPSPEVFLQAYHRASHQTTNILCITIPAQLSGMYNSAQLAIEMAKKTIPHVKIEVLDCGTVAAAQGFIVLLAARAATTGKDLTDLLEITKDMIPRVYVFGVLDTLDYLVKGGRVPKVAALASLLLKIKPIFTVKGGLAHSVTNARTNVGAIKDLLKILEEKIVKGQPLHVAVMHAGALERAQELKDQISSRFECSELFITEFTPVMGVHTGPGLIGIAFYSGN